MGFAGRRARNHDRRRQRTKRRCIHGGRRIGDHRRIRDPRRFGSAGRLGRARRGFAVDAQALDRGARQIVGIAPFIRRSCSLDRGCWSHRRNRRRRGIHGLHGRRQYDPDLFLFARRRGMAALVGRLGRTFGRFHIGLGIGRLGIGGLGIGRLGIGGFGIGFGVSLRVGFGFGFLAQLDRIRDDVSRRLQRSLPVQQAERGE